MFKGCGVDGRFCLEGVSRVILKYFVFIGEREFLCIGFVVCRFYLFVFEVL